MLLGPSERGAAMLTFWATFVAETFLLHWCVLPNPSHFNVASLKTSIRLTPALIPYSTLQELPAIPGGLSGLEL
jgi:hypothetical protein